MGMNKEEFMKRYIEDMEKKKLIKKKREQDIIAYEVAKSRKFRKIYG